VDRRAGADARFGAIVRSPPARGPTIALLPSANLFICLNIDCLSSNSE
jgi:hypothetical protein